MFESIILAGVNNVYLVGRPSVLGYFGTYGNVGSVEYDAESYSGDYSLTMTEDPIGGTPQVLSLTSLDWKPVTRSMHLPGSGS